MTLFEIIREVGELGCRSPRIQQDIKGFVNRAQRAIAERRNWTFMHSRPSVTIAAGQTSTNLPVNFKALGTKKPVTYTQPLASFPQPCTVKSREELEAVCPGFNSVVSSPGGWGPPFYVFLEKNDDGRWTLNTPLGYPHATDATYVVSCYLYPADMVLGDDETTMTQHGDLTEAILNKTRALAWTAENPTDPRIGSALALYEQQLSNATSQDARTALSGRSVHW